MTISFIAGAHQAGAGTTSAIDTTGADLLVAMTVGQSTPGTFTDSKGNTWTALTTRTGGASASAKMWYVANALVGAGHTFSLSGTFPGFCVLAFAGADLSSPLDQQNGANSVASGGGPGSVTPSENDELLVAMAAGADNLSSIGSSFTLQEKINLGGTNYAAALAYLIQTTAGAVNPAWTYATDTYGDGQHIATFKVAAAGGGGRTTKNTRAFPLGVNVGMGFQNCNI